MMISVDDLREKDKNLYKNMPSRQEAENSDGKTKQFILFEKKVRNFLSEVAEASRDVRFIEDYQWISETVTFWERYLESMDPMKIADFRILKPENALLSRSESDQLCNKFLEKINQDSFLNGSNLYYVVNFPRLIRKTVYEILRKNRHLGSQLIKPILGEWHDYQNAGQAIRQVMDKYQSVLSTQDKNLKPIVCLYDYASENLSFSTKNTKRPGVLPQSGRESGIDYYRNEILIELIELQKCKVPLLYFTHDLNFEKFDHFHDLKKRCKVVIITDEYDINIQYKSSWEFLRSLPTVIESIGGRIRPNASKSQTPYPTTSSFA